MRCNYDSSIFKIEANKNSDSGTVKCYTINLKKAYNLIGDFNINDVTKPIILDVEYGG